MKENGITLKMERNKQFPAETIITDANHADDLRLLVNSRDQV